MEKDMASKTIIDMVQKTYARLQLELPAPKASRFPTELLQTTWGNEL
jgi:hypothetical protein